MVLERLRTAIMYGELALGAPVSEDKLAGLLGVSRTPVREALTALQMQGLVTILPQRGSFVFQPTDADVAAICDYRALLETEALRRAHRHALAATLDGIVAAQAAMEVAEAAGDARAAAEADAAFHNAVIDHAGNRLIAQAYTLVSGQVGAIRFFARTSSRSQSYSGEQHREIISAFRAGDLDHASRVLTVHVTNMRTHFAEASAAAVLEERT